MTLTIQNANITLLETIEQIIKLAPNSNYKLEVSDDDNYSDEFASQIKKESAKLDKQIKNGTAKKFKNMAEYRKYYGE